MKVTGGAKLARQLRHMPVEVRQEIKKTVTAKTEATARLARRLAPVGNGKTAGQTKAWIHTKYDEEGGIRGSVEAAPPTKAAQKKVRAVEFGRKKGNRGTTKPVPYMRASIRFAAKRFRRAIWLAVRRGAKRATNG